MLPYKVVEETIHRIQDHSDSWDDQQVLEQCLQAEKIRVSLKPIQDAAVSLLRLIQSTMTDQQRLDLWKSLQKGHCDHCGAEIPPGSRCYCMADE